MAYDQITANILREIERLRDERDALRHALEVIAVGDSKDPVIDAGDELVALGYWRGEAVAAMRARHCWRVGPARSILFAAVPHGREQEDMTSCSFGSALPDNGESFGEGVGE